MNENKIASKKNAHSDQRSTLPNVILSHMETISLKYKNEIGNITEQLQNYNGDDLNFIECLKKEKQNYEQKIENERNQYLLSAIPYINRLIDSNKNDEKDDTDDNDEQCYHMGEKVIRGKIDQFCTRRISKNKGKIYRDFMKDIMSTTFTNDDDEDENDIPLDKKLSCSNCARQLILIPAESIAVCQTCGISIYYQEYTSISTIYDQSTANNITTHFAYKRINHFKEWLTQIQGKESTTIPDSIIDEVKKELKKERISDTAKITPKKIRTYLKKIGKSNYYEHATIIVNRICNRKPPDISFETEETLIEMFKQIQEPFKNNRPANRKNFLSYSFTLHKMCQLIDRYDLLVLFPLLKSRDKLHQQDIIWKGICKELNWRFIPSV